MFYSDTEEDEIRKRRFLVQLSWETVYWNMKKIILYYMGNNNTKFTVSQVPYY